MCLKHPMMPGMGVNTHRTIALKARAIADSVSCLKQ